MIIPEEAELRPGVFTRETARRAAVVLRECGFVLLDNFFNRSHMGQWSASFDKFTATPEATRDFKYPCQGKKRVEHAVPFAAPFNDTHALHTDPRLLDIGVAFLDGHFKLELMTVIDSPPGSGDQRWHQGWRYLFHPEERLPPYAMVVTIPLTDVLPEMGPTNFCPGKKLRFYQGYRCKEEPIAAGSSLGTVAIFDYKLLHRGPANRHPTKSRPMISMVFSKPFFINSEAMVNRGISLPQTLHQRRYMEQYTWHPDAAEAAVAVAPKGGAGRPNHSVDELPERQGNDSDVAPTVSEEVCVGRPV